MAAPKVQHELVKKPHVIKQVLKTSTEKRLIVILENASLETVKLIQYKEQGDLAFQLLIKSQLIEEPLDLALLMAHSLTPVPPCLGTPDGFFAKTNKAAMLHQLLTDHTDDVHYPTDALHIQDGNALFHSLTDLPPTFGGICLKILDSMTPKKNFIFSTDCYSINSIKSQERNRRGVTQAHHLDGPSTRKPADMKQFLQNDENKQQLCRLLQSVWCSNEASSRLENCTVAVVVVDGAAHRLSAKDGNVSTAEIASLRSNQVGKQYELLNCDKHKNLGRKFKKDIMQYRPDITHQCLLMLMDSPLNRAGLLQVYVHTQKNVLIEINPQTRIPRTFDRFCGLMVQLLHKLSIHASDGPQKLLKVIRNPIGDHLPVGSKKICMTFQAEECVNVRDIVPKDEPVVYVIGAMAHGSVDVDYTEKEYSISNYPLSAALTCAKVCSGFEEVWGVV